MWGPFSQNDLGQRLAESTGTPACSTCKEPHTCSRVLVLFGVPCQGVGVANVRVFRTRMRTREQHGQGAETCAAWRA
eukprot:6485307-Alexandrium_andersonii.AAC.1